MTKTTYVETMFSEWHIEKRSVRVGDHFESRTECGKRFVPRNISVNSDIHACAECREKRAARKERGQ